VYGSHIKNNLKIFYTNADQFLNRHDELTMLISNDKPDITLITEVLPKGLVDPIPSSKLTIDGYKFYINFVNDKSNLGSSGICGIIIYASNTLTSTQYSVPNCDFEEHL